MVRDHHHAAEFKQYIPASEYLELGESLNEALAEIARLEKRPEVMLSDDEEYIEIDWYTRPGQTLILSIGRQGDIACAGLSKTLGDTCCDEITPTVFNAISEFIQDE